ncbi:MAG: ribonuclease P protein component [Planctomycetota bacterium]
MTDHRFPKSARLLKSVEFQRVYSGKLFAADNVLVIKGVANGTDKTRLGLAVGKRVGNAVVRNRWKRVIRDAFRRYRDELPAGLDLVVRPKRGAQCNHASVVRSLKRLSNRLKKSMAKQAAVDANRSTTVKRPEER